MRIENVGPYVAGSSASNYNVVIEHGAEEGRAGTVVRGHPGRSASPWWLIAKALLLSGYELLPLPRR